MIPDLEIYADSKRTELATAGIRIEIKKAEIRPKMMKMSVSFWSKDNLASLTVWDKGRKLPVEADTILFHIPTKDTTFTKTIEPTHPRELLNAFDELVRMLREH